ncbi:MAG: hypothetical protein HeimC2_40050 [Candidatus Heimdallarchaeota archaeon LC_2]|nr:MAG: hypothetical protein HeimC2_40050 [Candidatus Heimdallarchaeota archaeon LC_2]
MVFPQSIIARNVKTQEFTRNKNGKKDDINKIQHLLTEPYEYRFGIHSNIIVCSGYSKNLENNYDFIT